MEISLLIYFFCFAVFLCCVYLLSKEDYFLQRKDVGMETMYNAAFMVVFTGIFFAKISYIIFNFQPRFLNPSVFFQSLFSQGISVAGGVAGAIICIYLLGSYKKFPTDRLLDIFLTAIFSVLPILYVFFVFRTEKTLVSIWLLVPFLYTMFFIILVRIFKKGNLTEGTVGLLALFAFSIISLLAGIFEKMKRESASISLEDIVIIFLLFISLFLIVKKEQLLGPLQKKRK